MARTRTRKTKPPKASEVVVDEPQTDEVDDSEPEAEGEDPSTSDTIPPPPPTSREGSGRPPPPVKEPPAKAKPSRRDLGGAYRCKTRVALAKRTYAPDETLKLSDAEARHFLALDAVEALD